MKKVQSFARLVELVSSNKVYSSGYEIVEYPSESRVCFYNNIDLIGKTLLDDISSLSCIYSNICYYCTIERGKLVLSVYLNNEL